MNNSTWCCLLSSVFDAYEKLTELSIEDSIKNELSGDFETLMLAVGKKHTEHNVLWPHGECQVVKLTHGSLLGFSHSPVHKECSHVLCQAPLQVNEGKQVKTSFFFSFLIFKNWFALLIVAKHPSFLSFPGSWYSWQHPDQDHDLSLWNRHVGHSGVFPFEIREVTL